MSAHKPYKWIFLCIFLLLVIIVAMMRGKGVRKIEALETVSLGDLSQRIEGFHLTHFKGEKIDWELEAGSAIIHSGDENALVHPIDIIYITASGTPIKLFAEKGIYSIGKNTFFVGKEDGGVNINIGKGITIKSDDLAWSGDKKEIHSLGRIQVIGERFLLEGENLIANVDSGVYEINKNIRATVWQ